MARKSIDITIQAEGRDRGKVFRITEMPASQAEKWGTRAAMALAKSGINVPDAITMTGIEAMAVFSIHALAGADYASVEPLLDEMFRCIQIVPDPSRPDIVRALVENDIEEVATRLKLRSDVIELHTGFSIAGALSRASATPEASPSIS